MIRFRLYLLVASFAPPLAVALAGRPADVLRNVPLTALGWLPGAVHAISIVCDWAGRHDPDLLPGALGHA